ncbi:hypothetical protein CLAVI_000505 [Candidatus Clavichlamydia salmonicola]|uniref:hypothetical protein n=1 Tax=Candidatus Clavichlamydia salmonicola TaxID=469812 RepID=UPI001891ED58|nr:hypothetical protein [Candidatus Clavichlamydia salmonicola]MBF5050883.1 hypothetical protein [Candidatus Clavichlamydia salmonicola]
MSLCSSTYSYPCSSVFHSLLNTTIDANILRIIKTIGTIVFHILTLGIPLFIHYIFRHHLCGYFFTNDNFGAPYSRFINKTRPNSVQEIELFYCKEDEEIEEDLLLGDQIFNFSNYANKELAGFMHKASKHEKACRIRTQISRLDKEFLLYHPLQDNLSVFPALVTSWLISIFQRSIIGQPDIFSDISQLILHQEEFIISSSEAAQLSYLSATYISDLRKMPSADFIIRDIAPDSLKMSVLIKYLTLFSLFNYQKIFASNPVLPKELTNDNNFMGQLWSILLETPSVCNALKNHFHMKKTVKETNPHINIEQLLLSIIKEPIGWTLDSTTFPFLTDLTQKADLLTHEVIFSLFNEAHERLQSHPCISSFYQKFMKKHAPTPGLTFCFLKLVLPISAGKNYDSYNKFLTTYQYQCMIPAIQSIAASSSPLLCSPATPLSSIKDSIEKAMILKGIYQSMEKSYPFYRNHHPLFHKFFIAHSKHIELSIEASNSDGFLDPLAYDFYHLRNTQGIYTKYMQIIERSDFKEFTSQAIPSELSTEQALHMYLNYHPHVLEKSPLMTSWHQNATQLHKFAGYRATDFLKLEDPNIINLLKELNFIKPFSKKILHNASSSSSISQQGNLILKALTINLDATFQNPCMKNFFLQKQQPLSIALKVSSSLNTSYTTALSFLHSNPALENAFHDFQTSFFSSHQKYIMHNHQISSLIDTPQILSLFLTTESKNLLEAYKDPHHPLIMFNQSFNKISDQVLHMLTWSHEEHENLILLMNNFNNQHAALYSNLLKIPSVQLKFHEFLQEHPQFTSLINNITKKILFSSSHKNNPIYLKLLDPIIPSISLCSSFWDNNDPCERYSLSYDNTCSPEGFLQNGFAHPDPSHGSIHLLTANNQYLSLIPKNSILKMGNNNKETY